MIKTAYDEHYFTNIFYKGRPSSQRDKQRSTVIKRYKSGGNLLDVGCADSYLLHLLSKDFSVEGVDVSEYAVDLAREVLGNGGENVSVGDIENVPLPAKKYDVIVVFNILEHLQDPDAVLQKVYQSLKKDGILVGSVPNNYKVVGRAATQFFNVIDRTHISTHGVEEWRRLFRGSGFCKKREFGEIPVGRNRSFYLNGNRWPHLAFNYIFVYSK